MEIHTNNILNAGNCVLTLKKIKKNMHTNIGDYRTK
jgi:hypothetical protein